MHASYLIHGLYTIGSVGSVSQTMSSDCDIWICYNKNELDKTTCLYLNQKINLIKDWFDENIKMPIYFFLSDITDIKNSCFGSVDSESSGSAQKNILKEEFYRTTILICGKIPLWWICFDFENDIDYDDLLATTQKNLMNDFVDFGNINFADVHECFGSVLWQLNKSFKRPLKSIIKMLLLKMMLDEPHEEMLCCKLRRQILSTEDCKFVDHSIFTIESICNFYQKKKKKSQFAFLNQCFFLRCEIKTQTKNYTLKKQLVSDLLKKYPINIKTQLKLGNFSSWPFDAQLELGNKLFKFLLEIYKEIVTAQLGIANDIDKQDLTVLGRKISASYKPKNFKVPLLNKPIANLNLSFITFNTDGKTWGVYLDKDKTKFLYKNADIVYVINFIVWNELFDVNRIRMDPNSTWVTVQEIINLGTKIRNFFGTCDISDVEFSNFLNKEYITKMLVIVSFERSPKDKDINDFCIVYKNSWGEMFVERLNTSAKLKEFLQRTDVRESKAIVSYYVQRNCTYYEKIIERTKRVLSPFFQGLSD